ncbi:MULTISPECIES: hypothetical protein [unclassified Pantoea]|uniref:hypothetical protein n=1 Tax=unclassified Pantoea TaxID=2630326 RepID=UPI001123115B|nr:MULTISPECIES: hypothetical protein [unclassified Pantoea]TPE18903.1 hypothetical protein FJP62_02290 [Pantoea vagans]
MQRFKFGRGLAGFGRGSAARKKKGHKKTRQEKDQRAPQSGDFKEKQWHLLGLPADKKVLDVAKKFL